MKRNRALSVAFLLGAFLLIPAVPAQAHGFRGGWGWGWGWGGWGWGASWGYPEYGNPYYGYPYGYGYGYGNGRVSFARVKTDVDPEEARLYLDGKLIGTADDFDGYPDYLYLGKGHYKLEFQLEGYETKVIELDAEPGTTVKIDSKMPKIPGAKHYGSYGDVKLEGGTRRFFVKRNSATAPAESNDVRPNAYPESYPPPQPPGGRDENGDVQKAPAQNWRENPPARPESSQSASPTKRSDKSRLSLVVSPQDAAVYLDDRFVGTAEELGSLPMGLAVSAGKHTVTVSRPGFQDQSMDVQIEPGATQKIEISLKH
jgi:hypothetical protein